MYTIYNKDLLHNSQIVGPAYNAVPNEYTAHDQ